MKLNQRNLVALALSAVGLLVLPLLLQGFGNAWVRIADMALLYVLLALGLNIVVGYAGFGSNPVASSAEMAAILVVLKLEE